MLLDNHGIKSIMTRGSACAPSMWRKLMSSSQWRHSAPRAWRKHVCAFIFNIAHGVYNDIAGVFQWRPRHIFFNSGKAPMKWRGVANGVNDEMTVIIGGIGGVAER